MDGRFTSWHVAVAAEAVAAALFARCGYDVSVQYGANQPEYDLIVASGEQLLKVSAKGSQDGSWGLCQSHLRSKMAEYHAAIDRWLERHKPRTILCFVQFKGVGLTEMPRVYLATPAQVAQRLRETAKGRGDTILYERHEWTTRALQHGRDSRSENEIRTRSVVLGGRHPLTVPRVTRRFRECSLRLPQVRHGPGNAGHVRPAA